VRMRVEEVGILTVVFMGLWRGDGGFEVGGCDSKSVLVLVDCPVVDGTVQLNKRDGLNVEEVVSSWLKSAEITRRRKGEVVRINCLNNLGCGCSFS
jgi:hypothetical protein